MDEALKTKGVRSQDFYQKYLSGRVIDIGAGKDLVCDNAEGFDVEDGDANFITNYREKESYDTVHSSHCLEHMLSPLSALKEWWALIKPGGYLVLVVPHEDLYEQGFWPSKFNLDHKFTFRVDGQTSWSPVSHNIKELIGSLPDSKLVSLEVHSQGYNNAYKLSSSKRTRNDPLLVKFLKRIARFLPKGQLRDSARVTVENFAFKYFDIPIDQTMRGALAQIQVVAQKAPKI